MRLVLSSGGVKGCAFVGALTELNKTVPLSSFDSFVGCSIGAFVATLLAIGKGVEDIEKIMMEADPRIYLGLKTNGVNGLFKSQQLLTYLQKYIPPELEFGQLDKELVIIITNISKRKSMACSNINCSNVKVANVLKVSMSVPFLYDYSIIGGDIYADGAILNSFPSEFMEESSYGIEVGDKEQTKIQLNTFEYLNCLLNCLMTRERCKHPNYFFIECDYRGSFWLDKNTKSILFYQGKTQMERHLNPQ